MRRFAITCLTLSPPLSWCYRRLRRRAREGCRDGHSASDHPRSADAHQRRRLAHHHGAPVQVHAQQEHRDLPRVGRPHRFRKPRRATTRRLVVTVPARSPVSSRWRTAARSPRGSSCACSPASSPSSLPSASRRSSRPRVTATSRRRWRRQRRDLRRRFGSRQRPAGEQPRALNRTDPCLADTDADQMTDGWEFWSAKDLNVKAVPYPGKRPFPNALDPSDGAPAGISFSNIDFDGDGLSTLEEYRAWRYTGSSLDTARLGVGYESALGYSDGTKFSRASDVPPAPAFRSAEYGQPNPTQPFPESYNFSATTSATRASTATTSGTRTPTASRTTSRRLAPATPASGPATGRSTSARSTRGRRRPTARPILRSGRASSPSVRSPISTCRTRMSTATRCSTARTTRTPTTTTTSPSCTRSSPTWTATGSPPGAARIPASSRRSRSGPTTTRSTRSTPARPDMNSRSCPPYIPQG